MPTTTPPNTFYAIIFDHDGTLVDSEGIHCDCWNKVLAKHNQTLHFDDYCTRYNGLPTRETAQQLKSHYKLAGTSDELYNQKIAHLNHYLEDQPFPLLSDVIDTLNFLQNCDIPMAIASGANRHEVENSVNRHQLTHYFKAVCTKNDVANSKPSPDVYLHAAKMLDVDPKFCLAIEDSDTGYESAVRAGMHCLRLTASPQLPHEFTNMGAIAKQLTQWQREGILKLR